MRARIVALAILVMFAPSALARPALQDQTALERLPTAESIGPGWSVLTTYTVPVTDLSPAFRDLSSATYGGPNGARAHVAVYLVAEGMTAVRDSWELSNNDFRFYDNNTDSEYGVEDDLEDRPLPEGCADGRRVFGSDEVLGEDFPVGISLCAADPDMIVLTYASGEVDGQTGYLASDRLVELVLEQREAALNPASPQAGASGSPTTAAGTTPVASAPVASTPAATPAATPSGAASNASNAVKITAKDIFFEPKDATIPANTDVTFTITNEGVAAHNFSIDALNISEDVAPGETKEVVVNAPPGTYEFYCNVPGHKQAGMVGTLTVTPVPTSTPEPTSPPETTSTQTASRWCADSGYPEPSANGETAQTTALRADPSNAGALVRTLPTGTRLAVRANSRGRPDLVGSAGCDWVFVQVLETRQLGFVWADHVRIADRQKTPTPLPAPSPTPQPECVIPDHAQQLLDLLPTQAQVPEGMLLTNEAERSKADVIEQLGGTDEAAQLLDDWGWSGNAYRDFVADPGAANPGTLSFLNVSVHRFADAESAANAMVFFSDQVIFVQGLEEVEAPAIGETARLLKGAPDGSPLTVLYVQEGPFYIRIGGSAATVDGDPTPDVLKVAETLCVPHGSDTAPPQVPAAEATIAAQATEVAQLQAQQANAQVTATALAVVAASSVLDPNRQSLTIDTDLDALIARDPDAVNDARSQLSTQLSRFPLGCRAGFTLISGKAPGIEQGVDVAQAVDDVLRQFWPDIFSQNTGTEVFALPNEQPFGEVTIDIFFYSGCQPIAS